MGNVNGREDGGDDSDSSNPSGVEDGGGSGVDDMAEQYPSQVRGQTRGDGELMGRSPPSSPRAAQSPLMFAPQVPVLPLQRPDEIHIPSNSWMQTSPRYEEVGIEQGIPTMITWSQEANEVAVEGSWDDWKSRKPLQRSGKDFTLMKVLPSGVYHYRFIVDGQTRHAPDVPGAVDENGLHYNILDLQLGGNCLSIDVQHQHPDSYCQETEKENKRSKRKEELVLICIIVGAIFLLLLAVGLLVFYRRYHTRGVLEQQTAPKAMQDASPAEISSELLANARLISQAAKLGTQGGAPVYKQFTLEELVDATENFSKTTFLGEGSLGQVYKGKLENGSYVAIRSLALSRKYSVQNLKLQLDLLSKLRHPHLVAILGHCIDCVGQDDATVSRLFLVCEYIPNSDFRSHLSGSYILEGSMGTNNYPHPRISVKLSRFSNSMQDEALRNSH